jgi:hypothetical protein
MTLDSKHPFAPNNILIRVWRNKSSSLIFEKGIKLNIHGFSPLRVFGSSDEAHGFMVSGDCSGGGE